MIKFEVGKSYKYSNGVVATVTARTAKTIKFGNARVGGLRIENGVEILPKGATRSLTLSASEKVGE